MIWTNDYESPLGSILLAGDDEGLTGLWFTEGARYSGLGLSKDTRPREMDCFDQMKKGCRSYGCGTLFFILLILSGNCTVP